MNVMKLALLGTAALAAASVSARADDLTALKAQIEALNSRISQIESSPSVPAGYQLLSVSEANAIIVPGAEFDKSFGTKATNIGILPTADVPASTNIQWSGFVKAAVTYKSVNNKPVAVADTKAIDVRSKAGLKVVGTTETAVGEVGVAIALVAASKGAGLVNRGNHAVETDGYWGYWKMTPELTLAGGVSGTLANSSNMFDNRCSCNYINSGTVFANFVGDPSQIRLSYGSGPISFAVALEDYNNSGKKSALGVAGEMKYSGDSFGFDLNAGYWDNAIGDSDWTVNVGANMGLGDIATLGVAVGVGEDGLLLGNADRYTKAGMFLGFTLSDSVTAELGASYSNFKGVGKDNMTVAGGVYYTPVSQLTLGLEASYSDTKKVSKEVQAALVSVYRF
jgi:hypothetical protein